MDTINETTNYQDPSSVSVWPTAMRYGVFGALILIVIGLVMYLTGQIDIEANGGRGNTTSNIINWIVMIGASVLAIKHHRDVDLNGRISYGRSIGVGTATAFIFGLLMAIYTYVFFAFIAPELVEQIKEFSIIQMEEQGRSDEEIEQAEKYMPWLVSPGFFATVIALVSVIIGLIASLIGGAILKRE